MRDVILAIFNAQLILRRLNGLLKRISRPRQLHPHRADMNAKFDSLRGSHRRHIAQYAMEPPPVFEVP